MKWTKEQQLAINTVDFNITVSASAGAGKTAVLVERLMKRIIQDKVSVDKIVALTFTEAAAAEMKNRLLSELSKKFINNPDDLYLKEQITLLPSAKISTIHSFCLGILKDYYYILGLDPTSLNNILDQALINKIKAEAFEEGLKQFDTKRLENSLYSMSASAMNLDSLKNIILKTSSQSFEMPNPNEWLDNSIVMYKSYNTLKDLPKNFLDLFFNFLNNETKRIKTTVYQLDRTIDSLKDQVNVDNQKLWMKDVITSLKIAENALDSYDYENYRKAIEYIASIKHKNLNKQPDFQQLRDEYFSILNNILEMLYPEAQLLKDLAHNQDLAQNIVDLTKIYNDLYTKAILNEKGITFNDMEILTYKLLTKNNNEVANSLKIEFQDILVDEFQDTNTLQNQIIELVGRDNNIFRVGDVKQSIYRFRGAKPKLMQKLIETGNTKNHKTIFLSNNFRSKDAIVSYNNHLFSHLMNVEDFNSSYDEFDLVTVGTLDQKINSLPVELHLVNSENDAYVEFEDDYNLSSHQFRAQYIAKKIVELYKEDNDGKYNKFTVLVESHKNKEYLRQAFDMANIPYFIAMSDGFYDSYGVSVVLAYLKLILDRQDKISLTAILINLYGYSENEITSLFLIHNDMFKVSNNLNKNILTQINYFHINQNKVMLTQIIDYILSINDFYEQKISKQSRTNLDLFYESATQYQKEHTGIYGFIQQIELMQQEATSEASSISSDDNVVNVMTIHNSKGLQFDTVFLYSKSANLYMDNTSNFVVHPDLGLALKTVYLPQRIIKNNLANFLIRQYDHKEDLEEEMRKLYVAMTRSQNRLYVVDIFKFSKAKQYSSFSTNDVKNGIGYTGWINAIAQNHQSHNLKVKEIEYFEYDSLEKTVEKIEMIKKNEPQKIQSKPSKYEWPIKPLDLSVSEIHFDIGSSIHSAIEKLPNDNWSREMIKTINQDLSDFYIDKLIKLNQDSLFNTLLKTEVYKEFAFIANIDGTYQRGIIDFLAISNDSVNIVDFKTDSVESVEILLERYSDQLHFYKNAMKSSYSNKKINAYIYSIHLSEFIEIIWDSKKDTYLVVSFFIIIFI